LTLVVVHDGEGLISLAHFLKCILKNECFTDGGCVTGFYVIGKVRMAAIDFENAGHLFKNCNAARCGESGCFVLWHMAPEMWYIELAVGGSKVHAGCNGKLVCRHTPWLGSHAAKDPIRPLRRALQVYI
jgi:hypothetical protein